MLSKIKKYTIIVTIVSLTSIGSLRAQVERGTIAGTVRDSTGAVVPEVNIGVKNVNTGVESKTTSGGAGEYVVPNLIPGEYSLTASKQGFSTLDRSGIVLHVYDRLVVDLTLQVGAVTQTVEVTAAAPLLKSQSTSVVTLISRRDVSELPLNGRTVFQLAPLVAGVTNGIPTENANNTSIPDNARAAQGLAVNGLPQSANSYILDGVYNDQINQGLMAVIPPLEAIQEFTLETSNFRPEMGRGGGVMNMTIKSGTNKFHGEGFEFLRNSTLDARNFFDYSSAPRRLPNFVQNQFGGTFGGPIRKDKTFFFFDYQGFRQRQGLTYITVVPSEQLRSGNFQGTDRPIFDPTTTCGFGTNPACPVDTSGNEIVTRQPFPTNMTIDPSRFSPAATKILGFLPLPNGQVLGEGQGLFYSSASRRNDQRNYDIKIDHRISDRDSLSGRWSQGESHTVLPGAFQSIPAFAPAIGSPVSVGGAGGLTGLVSNPSVNLGLQEIHNFSPTVINEARGAYVRAAANAVQLGFGHKYADQLGIPNVNVTDNNGGFPAMSISGLSTIGDTPFFPLNEIENVFQYLDNVTFISGKHTYKAGADFKKVQRQFTQILGDPAGGFNFGPSFTADPTNPTNTGNAFADFLLGLTGSANLIRNSGLAGLRSTEFSAYWQDTWRATSKLTVDYGVRYDLFTPQTEVHDRQTNFDLRTAQLLLPPGTNGSNPNYHNRALVRTPKHDFGPRLGLAYTLTPNTVIRTAYGVFFFPQAQEGFQLTANPPFVGGTNYFNVSVPQQINRTLDQGFPTTNPFIPIDQFTGGINNINPDNATAYTQQWTFGIQRQLSVNTALEVDYVGSKITHLQDIWNPNAAFPGNGSPIAREPYGPVVGRDFSLGDYKDNRGWQWYNSLQITLTRRLASGFSLLTNYTWSHANGLAMCSLCQVNHQNILNLNADRGNSGTDYRHRFNASWLYELPFGRGKRWANNDSGVSNALVGGWQFGGLALIQSGEAYNVGGGAGRPNRICNGNAPPGGHTLQQWFDPSCFPLPAAVPDSVHGGVYIPYGNSGFNPLYGPGIVNFDLSAFKSFAITESKRLEFRSEAFNVFNKAHFGLPQASVPSASAGRILSAGPARQVQLVLKFIF